MKVEDLDPGIRRTVLLLRQHGFQTTDSGDGTSKLSAGWPPDEVLPFPHCFMTIPPGRMVEEAERLYGLFFWPEAGVEASYDPRSGMAILMLRDVDDASLVERGIIAPDPDLRESPEKGTQP